MHVQLTVAPARWRNVAGLTRLIRESRRRRQEGAALVWTPRWSPTLGLLQSVWGPPVPGVPGPQSLVAEQDGRPVGLAQMRPRREAHQWEVVYLAVETPPAEGLASPNDGAAEVVPVPEPDERPAAPVQLLPDRRVTRLLGGLCDAGVTLGAERLFARIPEDDERYHVFRQVGFTPVVREYTFFRDLSPKTRVPPQSPPSGAIPGLRPQRRPDAYRVLQLYQECTPKVVQLAEGKRSRSWELPGGGLPQFTRRAMARHWVVERDARLVAWLQATLERNGPHSLRLMVADKERELHDAMIAFALMQLAAQPAPGVVVRVREHQRLLISALEACGFEPVDEQILMVKQLAARVTQHQFAPMLEKVV